MSGSGTLQIALPRGINVGGRTKLAMADLRRMLIELGFEQPRTLLQSGNVVFRSETVTGAELEWLLETETEQRLGLRTAFMVRTAGEWRALVAANPFPEAAANDPGHLLVMFLKDVPAPASVQAVQAAITGPETVAAVGRELFIVYPNGIGRSKLNLKDLGAHGTGRNWNTVLKVATLVSG